MAKRKGRRMPRRDSKGRFLRRSKKNTWPGHPAEHRTASRKGWDKRKSYKKGYAKPAGAIYAANPRRKSSRRRRRNPFTAIGRKGAFKIIPGMSEIKNAAIGGAGAVGSEVVRASVYSLIGRDLRSTSILEDAVGRILAGGVTGMLVGYVAGGSVGSKVTEGAYTVAMYELIADAAAMATGGKERVLGFIANPFANRMTKPLLPSFSLSSGAAPAVSADGTVQGLGTWQPEGQLLPLGTIMPEGQVVPLGEASASGRFRSRFG